MADVTTISRAPAADAVLSKPVASRGMATGPTAPEQRVILIDVLRGFALYFVFADNLLRFTSGYGLLRAPARAALPTAAWDRVAMVLLDTFVGQRVMLLFSFLFGLGFALQLIRSESSGEDPNRRMLRRLTTMLAIGAAHTALLFYGDIVLAYAVVGLALILVRRWPVGRLVAAGVTLSFVPLAWVVFVRLAPVFGRGGLDPAAAAAASATLSTTTVPALLTRPNYGAVVEANLRMAADIWSVWTLPTWLPLVAGAFLLGLAAGRLGLVQQTDRHLDRWRATFRWALALTVLGSLPRLTLEFTGTLASVPRDVVGMLRVFAYLGIPATAVTAACGLVLLFQRPSWRRRLMILAPLGRMTLTNYLLQSVIGVLLFYGVGFRLLGHIGAAPLIGLSLLVYAAQALASRWWLARYRFGPVEWFWRYATYGRPPQMRPATSAGAEVIS